MEVRVIDGVMERCSAAARYSITPVVSSVRLSRPSLW